LSFPKVSLTSFIFSIVISFVLSFLLSKIYKSQSNTFSNPERLANVFPLLSICTTIIISVVKSSLALSLGLVGALSIVRFRTPIKEPEELAYVFLAIGIGITTGADQYQMAIIGFILTTFAIYLNKKLNPKKNNSKEVRISIDGINPSEISNILELFSEVCSRIEFHNMTIPGQEENQETNISFSIIPKDFNKLNSLANNITSLYPSCSINIVDNFIY
ncbi:DUF4956 domain-containing protein, partial [Prochlorococcus sp. AH-716-O10]|nr:DUF4956 domain-containing protein [Prochlorococcus sp. AH-716-O10]